MLFNTVYSAAGEVHHGDIDIICILIMSGSLGSNFAVYAITQKILERSVPIFVGTLETLGQHEFAFGFCGSVGVEISRVRKKWVAAAQIRAL